MEEKHHYRKVFNSPYLSSADIIEPTVLTIQKVTQEIDKSKKTKEFFNTAYFTDKELRPGEELKPMILNATNSRTMKALTGSVWIEDWTNCPVTIYVDPNIRFGRDTVEGLRISTERLRTTKAALVPGTKAWDHAKSAYIRDGNLDAVEKRMTVSSENKEKLIAECAPEPGSEG